ncbi:STAS domain-containing protein [Pseudonocardia adelaidensis]|uniref:Anti-sigma factor antagonist n=1 Tax=Pseudonocardia adelaidensis TaxID=648754 RepID=A0ABP9NK79_9PSEU
MADHGEELIVSSRRAGDAAVVVVDGELDMLSAPQLQPEVERSLAEGIRRLVLDLTEVRFLGSSGLKVLLDVRDLAAARGLRLHVAVGDNRHVIRPLQIVELDTVLPLCGSVDEALQERGGPADAG